MSQASLDTHIDLINADLRFHQPIFESDLSRCPFARSSEGPDPLDETGKFRLIRVFWPFETGKFDSSGFQLKDDMGTVSIEVIYRYKIGNKKSFEEVAHSYRYFNPHHQYVFKHTLHDSDVSRDYFSFRYDKDLRASARQAHEPENHIQIMEHATPRFPIQKTSLREFLQVVKETCYSYDTDTKIITGAKYEPFFA